jgi:hypothetical protein
VRQVCNHGYNTELHPLQHAHARRRPPHLAALSWAKVALGWILRGFIHYIAYCNQSVFGAVRLLNFAALGFEVCRWSGPGWLDCFSSAKFVADAVE